MLHHDNDTTVHIIAYVLIFGPINGFRQTGIMPIGRPFGCVWRHAPGPMRAGGQNRADDGRLVR